MKVSVLMLAYNHEKFIAQAVNSVLMQQVNFDYEIVIGEDCSKDNTRDILVRYQQEYPNKIRLLLPEKNLGMHDNFIQTFTACQGSYIALLEGDDYWTSPDKLQKQVDFLDAHIDYTICFHNALKLFDDGSTLFYNYPSKCKKAWTLEDLLSLDNIMPTASIMLRKSFIDKFPDWIYKADFVDKTLQVVLAQYGDIGYIDETWSVYRIHLQGNWSQKSSSEGLLEMVNWCHCLQEYLNSKYQWKIKSLLSECYQHLATYYAENGNRRKAKEYTNKYLSLLILNRSYLKTTILLAFKIYAPHLFKFLKNNGQFIRKLITLCRHPSTILNDYIRPTILRKNIKHIYGLEEINYEINELIVLCVVRNGELYTKSFIEHYFSLGVKHIVLLDNDSSDSTIAIASSYKNVTILQTKCPYKIYEISMKKYLVKRFSKNRWNLFSDIDELFDYPFSNVLNLKSLLNYLNSKSYTYVVIQMLDLFYDKSLASLRSKKEDNIKKIYTYYDISNINKITYEYGISSNKEIKHYWSGIRKTIFGSNNSLTKASLILVDDKIEYFFNHHHVRNASMADFTCVFLHYPFVSSFYEKVVDAVKTDRYALSASHEYKMYWERLKKDPDLNIKQKTACKLENVNSLLQSDFLVVSEDYMQWVQKVSPQVRQLSNPHL